MNEVDPVPDLLVEQLALGELSEAEAAAVRARLGEEAESQPEALRGSDRAVLEQHPPVQVAAEIRRRVALLDAPEDAGQPHRWMLWLGAGALVAAAAAVSIWLGSGTETGLEPERGELVAVADPPVDRVRLKGDAAIVLRRQVGGGSELLAPGDEVTPGDALLVGYRAAGLPHGVLASLDGAGEVTLHFPADDGASTALKPAGVIALHTFELDDAPRFERFVFVTSQTPIDVGVVRARVATLDASDSPLEGVGEGQPWAVTDFLLVRTPAKPDR